MNLAESLRLAVRSIRGHKLRAALTALGIVIGIAAVITFVTLGASVKAEVVGQFDDSPANRVFLVASPDDDGGPPAALSQPVFTEYDVGRIEDIEGVDRVVPRGTIATSALSHGGETVARDQVTATTPALFESVTFRAGGPFADAESGDACPAEMVVTPSAAALFPGNLSVGDRVSVTQRGNRTRNVTVVGILDGDAGLNPLAGFGSQPRFYLPSCAYDTVVTSPTTGTRQNVYPQVTVVAENPGDTAAVQDRVQDYLDAESDAAQLAPESYAVSAQTNDDIVQRIETVVDRLTQFVTGIAVISLLVGAIGIANIMLVSVRERTKEIGIMKAVGATNRDVLQLFLVEALLLGVGGALLGVPVGVAGGWIAVTYAELPLTLPLGWVGAAIGIGLLVGVVSGLYPAWSAARVDPIDALRYE
ncbi:putative ABC transport system permease protein [Halorientalis persicus]|uniref:Putative ABC transport system permease protein n=1 Tax=Halorientalis persicus TaxID=1367881 RepID=A0A1H8JQW7_9EURY|nr:ABC transporter permease [Halorientalis persicus]SEN83163.1 putative ABC transport system permease protein [Halorientalis persicus]